MKNYFFLILLSIFLLIPVGASAFTLEDGTELTKENSRHYFDTQVYYEDSDFVNNYKYCVQRSTSVDDNSSRVYFYCFDETIYNEMTLIYWRSDDLKYQHW